MSDRETWRAEIEADPTEYRRICGRYIPEDEVPDRADVEDER